MNETNAHWKQSREIVERVVVTGDLVLLTPTHLGNGDAEGPTDMTLLRDPVDSTKALLTGASIAGALRNYLREVLHGYEKSASADSLVAQLCGGLRREDKGSQSLLIVDDALSAEPASIEIRDGVRIKPCTGTAAKGAKFDLELLQAGTRFPLRFELLIPKDEDGDQLKTALIRALQGFEREEIFLGARKRRGFGRCKIEQWQVVTYDLTTTDGLLAWLKKEENHAQQAKPIKDLLGTNTVLKEDKRRSFKIEATFRLDGSLLIRADAESGVDAGHLRSHRPEQGRVPVLPGTSLAGVLRHRALRIANTLATNGQGQKLVDEMFGNSKQDNLTASRVLVQETVVKNVQRLVQSRVKIDRFTGGAYPSALFSEEAIFGDADSQVHIGLELRNPQEHEIGLLLLLLKDLWTSDLPIGGESSVGRGRLQGIEAKLYWRCCGQETPWALKQTDNGIEIDGKPKPLEKCVDALQTHLSQEENHDQDS